MGHKTDMHPREEKPAKKPRLTDGVKPNAAIDETRDAVADPHSKLPDEVWVEAVTQLIHVEGAHAALLRIRRLARRSKYRHCSVCHEHMRRDEPGDHHEGCDPKFKAPHKRLLAEATATKEKAHAAQMDSEHFGVHSGIETGVKR